MDEANRNRLASVLYNLLECIRVATTLLSSFMPVSMPEVWEQICLDKGLATYENAGKFGVLPLNCSVVKGRVLFPRIDTEKEIDALNEILSGQSSGENDVPEKAEPVPMPDLINIASFGMKLILSLERDTK